MKKISYGFLLIGMFFLVACGSQAVSPGLQEQLTQQESRISNYHLTLKETETKNGETESVTQVVGNAAVWNDGTGYGTRIDKTDGKATNQMEVIATQARGAIRYYQDPWEETLSAQSSLQNVIVFPYRNVLQFANEVVGTNVTNWTMDGELNYKGTDTQVRQALKFLNVQVSESSSIEFRIQASIKEKQIQSFELKLIDTDAKITKEYVVHYSGMNQQQMRALPL